MISIEKYFVIVEFIVPQCKLLHRIPARLSKGLSRLPDKAVSAAMILDITQLSD